nr:NAD-dependent epimerase/dehydratase family protein [Blautia obeum]
MGEVFKEDIKSIVKAEFIPWEKLENRTILITGATGLIGSEIVNILAYMNAIRNLNISIVLVVRDKRKAKEKFKEIRKKDILKYIEGSMENFPEIPGNVDYIIHGASQTQSIEFVNHPIETIDIAIKGTSALLNLAREKK